MLIRVYSCVISAKLILVLLLISSFARNETLTSDLFDDNSKTRCITTNSTDADSTIELFVKLLRNNKWECAKQVIFSQSDVINFMSVFEIEQRNIVRELTNLKLSIESSVPKSSISPAFEWAQSLHEIMLNIKFSHKIDAPATLNVEATNVTITSNRLFLHATDGRKKFYLEIDLLKNITAEESKYDMGSVGRMTFTLKKETSNKWSQLTKISSKRPSNMHIWWEMQEKYQKELDSFDDDDDDEGKKVKMLKSKKNNKSNKRKTSDNESTQTAADLDENKKSDDNDYYRSKEALLSSVASVDSSTIISKNLSILNNIEEDIDVSSNSDQVGESVEQQLEQKSGSGIDIETESAKELEKVMN